MIKNLFYCLVFGILLYSSSMSTFAYYSGPINYPIPGLKNHSLSISNVSGTIYPSTPVLTGTTAPNAFVTVTLSGTQYTGYADGSGNWSIVLPTLTVGTYTPQVTAMLTGDALDEYNTGIVTRLVQQFASTSLPNFLVFDFQGNLFTPNGNDCAGATITQVTPLGVVSTLSETVAHTRCGLVFDSQGNLFVSSSTAAPQSISKVVTGGTATLFATPTNAGSFGLGDMVFDTYGNIYVTARGNNVIQRISPSGVVSVFATGFVNSFGISIDSSNNLYVAEFGGTIKKITAIGAVSVFATGFTSTSDIIFDGDNNMYVSDRLGSTIYKITPSGTRSVFATGLGSATSLAFGDDGNLYVSRRLNNSVDRVYVSQSLLTGSTTFSIVGLLPPPAPTILYPGSGSTITDITPTFSGTGSVSGDIITLTIYGVQYTGIVQSDLTWSITPSDIKLPDNRSYTISVTETNEGGTSPAAVETFRVQRYNPDTKDVDLTISNVSGAVSCMLPSITGTATPGSTVVATLSGYSFTGTADGSGNYTIPLSGNFADGDYTVDTTVIVTGVVLDSYTTGNVTKIINLLATGFDQPRNFAIDELGKLYLSNLLGLNGKANTISLFSSGSINTYAVGFNRPHTPLLDIRKNLYVSNYAAGGGNSISKITPGGTVSTFFSGLPNAPHGLAFDSLGNLYVANYAGGSSISKITTGGVGSIFYSGLPGNPLYIVFDKDGNLYVSIYNNNTIYKITPGGVLSSYINIPGEYPHALAFDYNGNLYVKMVDTSLGGSIYKVTNSGTYTTFLTGVGGLGGIQFDSLGNLFVTDFSNLYKVTSQSTLTKSIAFTKNCNALVTFVDYDGTVLQTGTVQYGSSVVAPVNPTRTGYTFSGWNPSDLNNITGDKVFTGEYTINYYTLSFEENGGSNVLDQTGIVYNTTGVAPANPIKTGYYFSGWYLSGSSIPFDFSTLITGDIIVYAYWNNIPVITYTLSFEEDGGTPVLDQTGIVYNTPGTHPGTPIKTGYIFSGWYLSGVSLPFDFSTPITDDTTLYAQWNPTPVIVTYTLSFEENGGTLVSNQTGILLNGTGTQPTNPIRTGYTFGGWYTSQALTTAYNFSTPITSNTTLYAKWIAQSSGGGGGGYTIVDPETFNPTVETTCFTPLDKKTIDQGIQVSEAFKIAHQMLYSYELTRWQGTRDYRPFDYLTREEAARFMVEFAINVLCRKPNRSYTDNFNDIGNSNPTLTKYIRMSYEYDIFHGDQLDESSKVSTTFRPNDKISRDEIIATMVRLVTNEYDEGVGELWATKYKSFLSRHVKAQLNSNARQDIAVTIYDLYRNNDYHMEDIGYVITY